MEFIMSKSIFLTLHYMSLVILIDFYPFHIILEILKKYVLMGTGCVGKHTHYITSSQNNIILVYSSQWQDTYIIASGKLKFWKSNDSFSYKLACVGIPYPPGLYDRGDFQNWKSKWKQFFWKFRKSRKNRGK